MPHVLDSMTKRKSIDSASLIGKKKDTVNWKQRDLDAINAGAKYGVTYGMTDKERDSVSKKNRPNWLSHLKAVDAEVVAKKNKK